MTKPTLNFIWIGPPMLNQGGHDVVGPETIAQNFRAYPELNTPANPMVFWCQKSYEVEYRAYFAVKAIPIKVCSIEDYLQSCEDEKANAEFILDCYKKIILDPARNRVLDRVNMKDMFSFFILGTQGNYVLDTNVQAYPDKPATFPDYPVFMFPMLIESDTKIECVDAWMQYAPPGDLSRAKQCLAYYLKYCARVMLVIEKSERLYTTIHHDIVGRMFTSSTALSDEHPFKRDQNDKTYQIWHCGELDHIDLEVPGLSIFKSYYNTHKIHVEHLLSPTHCHVISGERERLAFDLDHGINPDLEANPLRKYDIDPEIEHDATNQTLLHLAMWYSAHEKVRQCAQLLLERGADVNRVHSLTCYSKQHPNGITRQKCPLSYALLSESEEAVNILFTYARQPIQVNLILNNESLLIFAVHNKTGIELLLKHGADPNLTWPEQNDTPLSVAVREKNVEAVKLLLDAGANPQAIVRGNIGKYYYETSIEKIKTSAECKHLIETAIKNRPLSGNEKGKRSAISPLVAEGFHRPAPSADAEENKAGVADESDEVQGNITAPGKK